MVAEDYDFYVLIAGWTQIYNMQLLQIIGQVSWSCYVFS